ncbi:MAG: HAD family hydrolase [Sandaracinaceae bacterium]|nr:HAD family hydrolase [Sandaracinaceae bacterium]
MRGPFDAVLFDLDGTLLDSIALILESYRHTLAAHGLPPRRDEDVLSGLGTTLEAQFRRWGYEAELDALVATYVEHNLRVHDALVRPYEGVSEIVHALHARGVPLGLVTSKRRRGGVEGLRALGLEGRFAVEIYGDEVARPKPDPDPVHRALAGLGLAPSRRITFVGDAIHDVEAGRAAGIHTSAVTWGSGRLDELRAADAIAHDARELARVLLG